MFMPASMKINLFEPTCCNAQFGGFPLMNISLYPKVDQVQLAVNCKTYHA